MLCSLAIGSLFLLWYFLFIRSSLFIFNICHFLLSPFKNVFLLELKNFCLFTLFILRQYLLCLFTRVSSSLVLISKMTFSFLSNYFWMLSTHVRFSNSDICWPFISCVIFLMSFSTFYVCNHFDPFWTYFWLVFILYRMLFCSLFLQKLCKIFELDNSLLLIFIAT